MGSLYNYNHHPAYWVSLISSCIKTKGFEITGGSDDPLIVAGERLELTCEIDGEFDFCQWSYSDVWSCLTFSNAIDVQKSIKLFNVDVAMPASIEFGGDIVDAEEKWMLVEDEEVTFSCHGNGGTPAAEIFGFIGSEEEINEDEDDSLDENSSEEGANSDDERLLDASKEFSFTPSRDDCGKYLKCSAKQVNGDGDLLFEEVPQVSKQIMVVFPPKAHDEVYS